MIMTVHTDDRAAERRMLTILVVDMVASTALARRLDQEDFAELLNAFHDICGRIIDRFGGRVAKDLGDGLAAHFGWPASHEQDAEHAVLAGLEMVDAVKSISIHSDERIRLHVGIATGNVVVSDVKRASNPHVHEAFGELPSLASRVQGVSAPDCVLVSQETYELIRHNFVCVDAGRKRLRGFSRQVGLYQVIGPRRLPLTFDVRRAAGLTPLVGRAPELAYLNGQWQHVKNGRDSVVLIRGEAGIGKSRLCAEFLSSRTDEHSSFSFQCSQLHRNTPLYPVIRYIAQTTGLSDADSSQQKLEKLEAVLRDVGPVRPEALALLATHLGASKGQTVGQEMPIAERLSRLRRSLNALLVNLVLSPAKQHPVLIMLEDIHWMDPTTAEFLEMLMERIRDHAVLLIVTFRPHFSPNCKNGHDLVLDRLTPDETMQFIKLFAPAEQLPDTLVSHLVERSDGNPLYIEELTAAVLREHRTAKQRGSRGAEHDRSAIPSTLQESLLSRIDRTSAQARELVQCCAVLGRRFSYPQISAVADMPDRELHDTIAELVQEGLLYPSTGCHEVEYAFKHALIQSTAYSLIVRDKRRQLHLKCALALEAHFPAICQQEPGALGVHYENANKPEAAITYIFAAATSAIERSALLEARTWLLRGLDLLKKLPDSANRDRHELTFRSALGRVHIFSKGWADPSVKEQFERALLLAKQLESQKVQIPLEWALTTFRLLRGETAQAASGGRRLVGLAEHSQDPDLLLVAHSASSIYEFYSGNFLTAVSHSEEALRSYRGSTNEKLRKNFGTDRRLQALRGAALSHWCLGNYQLALDLDEQQRAGAMQHPFDYAYSLTISCILHSLGRNHQRMRSFADTAINLAQDQGFGFLEANAANFRAIALTLQNPGETSLREFDETIKKYRAAGNQMGVSSMFAIVAEQCGKIGCAQRGLDYLEQARRYVRRSGERFAQSDIFRVRGVLLATLGKTDDAQRCMARALVIARGQRAKAWELPAAIRLAHIHLSRGDFKRPRKLLQPLCDELAGSLFVSEQLSEANGLLAQCSLDTRATSSEQTS
jgi:predicted ATPase/class 3 adenylate cyclase